MGRKSLKTERVNEILNAFERCLEKKGLQASTLDNIAEEAGLARRMIRHYVGNREDLINAAVARIIETFNHTVFDIINKADHNKRLSFALEYLFSEAFSDLPATKHVAALLPVSLYDPQVSHAVKAIYDSFHLGLDHELKSYFPTAPDAQRLQTAYSIMCLSFGGGWMYNIGFDSTLNLQNKKIAEGLIAQLKTA